MIDPSEAAEPIDSTEASDPIEPIESTDPTEPIDSTELREPIDSSESSDQSDHFEADTGRRLAIRDTTSLTSGRGTASRRDKCSDHARPDWSPQALAESVSLVHEGVTLVG